MSLIPQPQSRFFLFNIAYKLFHFFLTYLSKYVVGQNIISIVDFFVEKLEKTLDFCIVKNEIDDVAHKRPKTAKETVHPIIWLMFLPALLWLRMFFFWASVVSIILGKGEVTAYEVVSVKTDNDFEINYNICFFIASASQEIPSLLSQRSLLRC